MPSASDYGVESVESILVDTYGLIGSHRGVEYDMICVNPDHLDSSPSCSVNLNTGYWNCFSCGVGGDLLELGVTVLKRPRREVLALLTPSTPEAKLTALRGKLARLTFKPTRKAKRAELPEYPPLGWHPELRKRLFTRETIERWELGWVEQQTMTGNKGEYTIRDSIAIPVKDAQGVNLAWCYRATDDSPSWQPRYLYTPGIEISELWFGLRHHAHVRSINIVEGALDAMWLDQNNMPALALLGSKMGDRKIMWLQNYHDVTTFPDYDTAGAKWQQRMLDMLGTRMPIRTAQYRSWMLKKTPEPDGSRRRAKDPEELIPIDLEFMHWTAVAAASHRLRNITQATSTY